MTQQITTTVPPEPDQYGRYLVTVTGGRVSGYFKISVELTKTGAVRANVSLSPHVLDADGMTALRDPLPGTDEVADGRVPHLPLRVDGVPYSGMVPLTSMDADTWEDWFPQPLHPLGDIHSECDARTRALITAAASWAASALVTPTFLARLRLAEQVQRDEQTVAAATEALTQATHAHEQATLALATSRTALDALA